MFYFVTLTGLGIATITQLFFGAFVFKKARGSEANIRGDLAVLFWLSFLFALLYTSGYLAIWGICAVYPSDSVIYVMFCISELFWILFPFVLLVNLVTRLYITFKGSALAMSQNTQYIFIFMIVVLFMLIVFYWTAIIMALYGDTELGSFLAFISIFPTLSVYIIGSAFAVYRFVRNLSTIAKKQSNPPQGSTVDPGKISLNERQLTLLHLSAKFILLFFVSILSTIAAFLLTFVVSRYLNPLFWSFDFCVNLLCLFLQFGFASNHYQKFCGCLDTCCRTMVEKQTKMTLHRESIAMQHRIASESVSPSVQKDRSGTIEV